MMKRCIFKAILSYFIFVATIFAAGEEKYAPITNFTGGLNSQYSSLSIADNEVQDALNVWFDEDSSVAKRNGYTVYSTTSSDKFTNGWSYTDSSNNNWIIVLSSNCIRASKGDSIFSVIIATVPTPTASLVDAVSAFGNIYFVDNVQGVYFWNGTSTTYVSGSPKGSLICEFKGRIVVAGESHPDQNRLSMSEHLNALNWTSGSLATDPITFIIGLTDKSDGITSLYSGLNDAIYIFKRNSIHALYGFDQDDFQARVLTSESGCIQGETVQPFAGGLLFLSKRGFEIFDGVSPKIVSKKVNNQLENALLSSFAQKSWTQTSQDDWSNGSTAMLTNSTTFPDYFNVLRDGTGGTQNVWTKYESGTITGSIAATGGYLTFSDAGNQLGRENIYTTGILPSFSAGTTYNFLINSMSVDTGSFSRLYMTLRPTVAVTPTNPDASGAAVAILTSSTTSRIYVSGLTITGRSGAGATTVDFALPATINFYLSATNYQLTINGSIALSGTHSATVGQEYLYFGYLKGSVGAGSCQVDNFNIIPAATTTVYNTSVTIVPDSVVLSSMSVQTFIDTSDADFNAGTLQNTIVSGNTLKLSQFITSVSSINQDTGSSSFNNYMHYAAQSFTSPSTWSYLTTVAFNIFASNNCSPTVILKADSGGTPGTTLQTGSALPNSTGWQSSTINYQLSPSTLYWIYINACGSGSDSYSQTYYGSNSNPYAGGSLIEPLGRSGWDAQFHFNLSGASLYRESGSILSRSFDVGVSTNDWLWNWDSFTVNSTLSGQTITYQTQSSDDNVNWDALASTTTLIPRRYIRYKALFSTTDQQVTPILSDLSLVTLPFRKSTGLFTSQIYNIGSGISSFGSFDVVSNLSSGGTLNYTICTSSSSNMIPSTCAVNSPNAYITTTSNAYVQVTTTFTITVSTQDPQLQSFTIKWNEGSRSPTSVSAIYKDKYWVSLTTSSLSNGNDCTFVMSYNLNRDALIWTKHDISAGAYILYRDELYHADSNSVGKVYKDYQGYNDAGNAINAYFVTKDFVFDGIHIEKVFDGLWVVSDALGNYDLSTSYYIDRYKTNEFALDTISLDEQNGLIDIKLPFPINTNHQVFGKSVAFKFSNNVLDSPMRVYGGILGYYVRKPE
jgi:hypothetical protein